MSKVLVVEDDQLIVELERDYLETGGFEVEIDLTGYLVVEKIESEDYNALILDVMLPGKSGFDICREVRKCIHIPIIIVTAKKRMWIRSRG